MKSDFGILYVATGEKYFAECERSAKSAKKTMPQLPIALWTDRVEKRGKKYFDIIHKISEPKNTFFDKIRPMIDTDFEKTLFVDTDTIFLDNIFEISNLLDKFEIAYAHAPWRIAPFKGHVIPEIPICFPEPNTGVIAYRKTHIVTELFENWEKIYTDQLETDTPPIHDQPALRKALYLSDVSSYILPPEYNIRTGFPVFKGGGCPAKILHGRGPSLREAFNQINRSDRISIFHFKNETMVTKLKEKILWYLVKFKNKLS